MLLHMFFKPRAGSVACTLVFFQGSRTPQCKYGVVHLDILIGQRNVSLINCELDV
jgi:hypothetical protein